MDAHCAYCSPNALDRLNVEKVEVFVPAAYRSTSPLRYAGVEGVCRPGDGPAAGLFHLGHGGLQDLATPRECAAGIAIPA